jgi:DNA-binding Lrp family transcriptional regulator
MLAGFAGYPEDLKIIPSEPIGIELSEQTLLQIAPKEWLLEKAGIDISKYQPTAQLVQEIVQAAAFTDVDSLKVFDEFGEAKDKFNILKQKTAFQDVELFADVSQLQSSILDLISKDKRITPEVIADTLNEKVDYINNIIKDLEDKGFLKSKESKVGKGIEENIIIERSLTQPLSDIVEAVKPKTTAFLIRYSYEWKNIVPASQRDTITHPSRDFCKYVMAVDKMYTRSEIETMSARLGYSVFDRRGGWWTMPNGTHSESCRHEWNSNIVTRK